MNNFWDYEVWGFVNLIAVLLFSLIVANLLKKSIPFLKNSLIPTSVLGGVLLLLFSVGYKAIFKVNMFDTKFFGGNGLYVLECLTYHALALGFICTTYRNAKAKFNRKRTVEIFNTGVTTVSVYLLQGILGLAITIVFSLIATDFFAAAGILLPFGFGQGTGQALNYGNIYELDWGFKGGSTFGLSIAALGFLSASFGGILCLNIMKRKGKLVERRKSQGEVICTDQIQNADEIPMNGSIDKLTAQLAIILVTYILSYLIIFALGVLIPSLKTVLYGFNFLVGVLMATLVKNILAKLNDVKIVKRVYINPFLMTRVGGFFFDIMIVAGIAAIQIEVLSGYWLILIILAVAGMISTYLYNRLVAKRLFPEYEDEQFLAMYGMLTGTASTGMVLLRELDPEYKTPVSDNMVYQNLPAMVFGFPMMLIATLAPKDPILTLFILAAFFVVMNLILFRSFIFKRKGGKKSNSESLSEKSE